MNFAAVQLTLCVRACHISQNSLVRLHPIVSTLLVVSHHWVTVLFGADRFQSNIDDIRGNRQSFIGHAAFTIYIYIYIYISVTRRFECCNRVVYARMYRSTACSYELVMCCGVVGSTLAFGSIGRGFESEHRLFSHHSASAFSKLRSLAKCSLDDSVRRLLFFTQLATLWGWRIE